MSGRWTNAQLARLAGWFVVAVAGAVAITQALGWTPTRGVAVVQSLTPYIGMALVPVLAFALWRSRLAMVTTGIAIGLALLLLSAPLALPADQAEPIDDARGLSVAALNLLYRNERVDDVARALQQIAPDVIVLSEYTAEHQSVLEESRLAADYPHRIDRIGLAGGGGAVWSRYPLDAHVPPDTVNYTIDVSVSGPDGDVRLLALHVPTPINSFRGWQDDLDAAARFARGADGAAMVVGDLNATYWHPPFRDLLDAGLTDVHTALGRGFSTSWPTDRLVVPAFVRLDHALVTDELVAVDVHDFDVPGSDHRGFVVTVVPAR